MMIYHTSMDWSEVIRKLEQRMTHTEIAEAAGMASSGHVHNLKSGRQKTVSYELGERLKLLLRKQRYRT